MVSIRYILHDGIGEWDSVIGKGQLVEFDLGEGVNGRLSLGGREAKLTGGRCRISTASLPFGQYAPVLTSGEQIIPLEPLVITGERVTPAPTSDVMLRLALKRIGAIEGKIKIIEERISEQNALIKGGALFG